MKLEAASLAMAAMKLYCLKTGGKKSLKCHNIIRITAPSAFSSTRAQLGPKSCYDARIWVSTATVRVFAAGGAGGVKRKPRLFHYYKYFSSLPPSEELATIFTPWQRLQSIFRGSVFGRVAAQRVRDSAPGGTTRGFPICVVVLLFQGYVFF